jgi:hypothetical protein
MNESTALQLKILVERAVRPVQAGIESKRKMREELFSHVTLAFEDELARLNDEPAALERAARRLGDPAELTRQLQETARCWRWTIWWVEQWLVPVSGGSTMRRALRFGLLALITFAVLLLPLFVFKHRLHEWPLIFLPPLGLSVAIAMLDWMRESLSLPGWQRWWRAILIGLASALVTPAVTFAFCLIISGNPGLSLGMGLSLLPVNLVATPLLLVIMAYGTMKEVQYQREWASLPIA